MSDVEPVERVTGTAIPVRGNDVDTDRIIPARFLKAVTFDGLGRHAFHDARFAETDEGVREKDHPFNEERFEGASVLVVNANFGCGSSREHAPQALVRRGIDAIVGESFADIFAGNCLALGVPTVTADPETVRRLQRYVDANPDERVAVNVREETIRFDGTDHVAGVDDAQRRALVDGVWDTTALLRSNETAVAETAASLPYTGVER